MRTIPLLVVLVSAIAASASAQDCGGQPDPSANNPPVASPDPARAGPSDGLGSVLGDGLSLWWDPFTGWGGVGGSDVPPAPDPGGGTGDLSKLLPSPLPGPSVEGPSEPTTPVFYVWTLPELMRLVDPFVPPADFEWDAEAEPIVYKRTGIRSFYIDETGILLGTDTPSDPVPSMPEI